MILAIDAPGKMVMVALEYIFQRLSFACRAAGRCAWTDADKGFVQAFASVFLGPMAGISHHWHGRTAAAPHGGEPLIRNGDPGPRGQTRAP